MPFVDGTSTGWDMPAGAATQLRLTLFGVWQLTKGQQPVRVPARAQRVLGLLALSGPRPRAYVAGTIWPEADEQRALASLRTTLWRMHRWGHEPLVIAGDDVLALNDAISVDVHDFLERGDALIRGHPINVESWRCVIPSQELLPGWYDDWVLLERERLRQLRLHALEVMADRLLAVGRTAEALEAALQAVAIEPLRESAHRIAIQIHLAEDNASEALRQFEGYRELARRELGVRPSARMRSLVDPVLRARHTRQRRIRQAVRSSVAPI